MKKRLLLIIILLIFVFIFLACASTKNTAVQYKKISSIQLDKIIKNNKFNWIDDKNTLFKTYKNKVSPTEIIYTQELSEFKKDGSRIIIYFKENNKNPTDKNLLIIGYLLNYTEKGKSTNKKLVTIQWINCQVVCKDKKLKKFIQESN